MSPIEDTLFRLIEQKTGVRPAAHLSFAALEIDSLGMAELTCEIEKAFGIRVGDDIADVTNVAELVAYVEAKRGCARVS
ncbi:MAG: acyl carrier protein [Pirellulaceae bacterium]|jgi:acyl carrier protein|nr:acyl carrier protein [Pirellulaceae bacterium]